MRIIGGEWRGRWLEFSGSGELRPTGDRMRETLFNWLQFELHGKRCLDLFAGSGALGFEAASRGAAEVVLVEPHPAAAGALKGNIERLGAGKLQLIRQRAEDFLATTPAGFDVVFLDPPFSRDLLAEVFAALQAGWLNPGAWIYVEQPRDTQLPETPAEWALHREKPQGQVSARLFRREICCTAT